MFEFRKGKHTYESPNILLSIPKSIYTHKNKTPYRAKSLQKYHI